MAPNYWCSSYPNAGFMSLHLESVLNRMQSRRHHVTSKRVEDSVPFTWFSGCSHGVGFGEWGRREKPDMLVGWQSISCLLHPFLLPPTPRFYLCLLIDSIVSSYSSPDSSSEYQSSYPISSGPVTSPGNWGGELCWWAERTRQGQVAPGNIMNSSPEEASVEIII